MINGLSMYSYYLSFIFTFIAFFYFGIEDEAEDVVYISIWFCVICEIIVRRFFDNQILSFVTMTSVGVASASTFVTIAYILEN